MKVGMERYCMTGKSMNLSSFSPKNEKMGLLM